MTLKTTQLRDAITFALAVGSTAAAGTGIAFAQEGEKATTLDRIEVTGSRIKRADIETSQPIFSLSRDDITAQGLTSVGDVIQNITANGSTLNSTYNNGGNGETRVNLRNLGSNRTLVLVNGRRWVGGTGLGGAVDLNTIPTAAVERIEVLKDGASTIYGSDAIAGVVNVILRQNFEGAEANAYIGQFDKGDGTRQAYDFIIGTSGDRFSAMLGYGYVKEEPVMAGDRYISKEPTYTTGNFFGSGTSPNGRFGAGEGCQRQNAAGQLLWTRADGQPGFVTTPQFDEEGNELQARVARGAKLPGSALCVPGTLTYDGPGTAARPYVPGADAYNFAPENYLLTPQERRSVFGNASVDITDDIRFKTTVTYNERVSEQLLAAMPVTLGQPVAGTPAGTVVIDADNAYNPFGEDITRISRRTTETGGRSFNQDVRTFAMTAGLEGTLNFAEKYFDWEAGYFRGQNKANNTTFGLFNVEALRSALGPSFVDADGTLKCGTSADTVIDGCVPMNFLGGVGGITQEMLDYSTFTAHDEYSYTQQSYYANISGDLFALPGGPLGFSFGLEHRTEDGYDSPDALINSGSTTGNARTATAGGYKLDEAYLELAVPVLSDVPFAKLLDFSLATRYSDYSNFGDTLNSKFGFRWKPIEDLLVRGNWSEGFRAPSIAELFAGQADSFPTLSDPCNSSNFATLAPQAQAQCLAEGVPAGGYRQDSQQIRITVGGNPDLKPEKAESTTFGFVYSPSYVEGLDVSLDWWTIKIEDAITTIGGETIIQQCVDSGGAGQTCGLYTRQSDGNILTLINTTTNIGGTKVEGYDLTVGYRLPETAWGKFSFTWDTTYLAEQKDDIDGDGVYGEDNQLAPAIGQPLHYNEGGNLVGEYLQNDNKWRIRSNLMARWELGDWGATWSVRYYSSQDESCSPAYEEYGFGYLCTDGDRRIGIPTDANNNGVWDGTAGGDTIESILDPQHHIGATTYHDVSVYWNAPWNAKIAIGVNNLFDKNPPIVLNAFANTFDPQYELPGQFIYFRYSQKF
ncbi:TonB-dependent receptor domain-containing protein [Lysobacter auxotrophicus]|uniref:TonB-dependent receptor n=1 Tax=Lysobacter auxotrophicus TaxID=2992573 RepID=A0ABN6UN25_9GAMM|nr:TonB-dependent receptor [Lysobacter auxotrophicus]BDU17751.1 TonB-dependent receptor [Lysobacter auxotrophicus]